jgi:UDP-N-acetylglucosamine--N-acetylmuramyl-(pentapeptide) pyrophosphoryl-undecaprenol N-acetylglucosamine transferase
MKYKREEKKVIAFTGGGTGGHIYPGLAVADALREITDCRVVWIGASKGMDRSIVERAGIEFLGVSSGKLRRYFSVLNFIDIFKITAGFIQAVFLLKKYKPRILFSKGGFVSVPPAFAASVLGVPVFTHESDFSPGLATRINARFAKKIFTAYEKTGHFFPKKYSDKIVQTGNPVRPAFYSASPEEGRAFLNVPAGEKILLVLGGSQGAKEINGLVQSCLEELTKLFFVVHQTGEANTVNTNSMPRYAAFPYINEEMPQVIAAANLVLARSGAGTIWECAAVGKPMLLVPLCGSGTRGDQVENARFFEEKGAALMLIRPDAQTLLNALRPLARDEGRLSAMAAASAQIGTLRGAPVIARHISLEIGGDS